MHDTPRRIIAAAVTLLLVCVVHSTQEAHAVTANNFTAEQQTHTTRFLKGFLSGATELQSTWTGTDFCRWRGVSCPDATTVNVDLSGQTLGSAVTLPELDDDVDGSHVMVRELRMDNHRSYVSGTLPESWSRLTQLRELALEITDLDGTLPASWGGMTALDTFYLYANDRTGFPLIERRLMKAVWSLSLMKNSVSGPPPVVWESLPGESCVYLTDNAFCRCRPASWRGVHEKNTVYVNMTGWIGTLPTEWASMKGVWNTSHRKESLLEALPASSNGSLLAHQYMFMTDNTSCRCLPTLLTAVEYLHYRVLRAPCATANAFTAPAKSSVRNLTALWVVLGLRGCCLSIAGVVVAVVLYRRRCGREGGHQGCVGH